MSENHNSVTGKICLLSEAFSVAKITHLKAQGQLKALALPVISMS